MSYEIIATPRFKKDIKKLAKKYPSLKHEYAELIDSLIQHPEQGIPLGSHCFKICLATTMTTLTVNISDEKSEKEVRAFLDSMGLNYSIDAAYWWKNKNLVNELDKRSNDLRNGKDEGVSFNEIKNNLLKA